MSAFTRLRTLIHNLTGHGAVENELSEELETYVELVVAEKIRRGMSAEDARRATHIEIGGIDMVKEQVRDERPGMMIENAGRDLRYGLRQLRRSPGFALIAVLTIALGIGATSAIFSVINAVALKPLPYPNSERLVFITSQFPTLGFDKFWVSPPEYFEFRERSKSYTDVAAYRTTAINVSDGSRPERVNAVAVTANMFSVLGVRPELGAPFKAEDDLPNSEPVVLISHGLWQRTFGGDPAIVGKSIDVQGKKRRVLGVTPPGYDLHDSRADVWIPMGLDPANRQNRGSHFLYLVGRLKPGITEAQASSEITSMVRQWGQLNPGTHTPNDSTHRMQLASLRSEVVGNVARALWVLQGAVVLVLLIACANVANLLLVRAEGRHKEFSIRTALGAGKGRILRQFTAEGLVLTVIGATLGLAIANWGLKALLSAYPDSIPRSSEIAIDPRVLLFTTVVAVVTATIFGLAPLLHLGDNAVAAAMRDGGTRSTQSATRHRVRRALVAAEVALAVMLVVGAGLLIRSFRNLTTVDAGFDSQNLTTFGLVLPPATYADAERRAQFFAEVVRKLDAIPGVQTASVMAGLPPNRPVNANDTDMDGVPMGKEYPPKNVDYWNNVGVDYFKTMKIPMVRGRGFEPGDVAGAGVAVINESMAKRFYPNTDPIGRRVRPPGPDTATWFTIVGVAKDVKQGGLDQKPGTELYFNLEQGPRINQYSPSSMNFAIRSPRGAAALAPAIQGVIRSMDPSLPIVQLRDMSSVFADSVSRQRFLSLLLGIFAAVALMLAAIGTYGVLSYLVTERQREIGIRVALGASNGGIVRLVLGQGLSIAVAGVAAGVVGALLLARVTQSLLFGVSPTDPGTYVAVCATIFVVALIACLVPAQRAMRVDPLVAIRGD